MTYAEIIEELIRSACWSAIKEEYCPEIQEALLSEFPLWCRLNAAIVEVEVTAEDPKVRAEAERLWAEYVNWQMAEHEAEEAEQDAKTAKQDAEAAEELLKYLTETGFPTLGDALAFYAGNAAPPRCEGMIDLDKPKKRKP
jgi:hypothetical protein